MKKRFCFIYAICFLQLYQLPQCVIYHNQFACLWSVAMSAWLNILYECVIKKCMPILSWRHLFEWMIKTKIAIALPSHGCCSHLGRPKNKFVLAVFSVYYIQIALKNVKLLHLPRVQTFKYGQLSHFLCLIDYWEALSVLLRGGGWDKRIKVWLRLPQKPMQVDGETQLGTFPCCFLLVSDIFAVTSSPLSRHGFDPIGSCLLVLTSFTSSSSAPTGQSMPGSVNVYRNAHDIACYLLKDP